MLLVGLLTLWWFVLRQPMQVLLRDSMGVFGGFMLGIPASTLISDSPSGDWTFDVPIEFDATSPNGAPVHFRSVNFDMARADISDFTFSLPVYWAIILAAPWSDRSRRALIQGTLLLAVVETFLLFVLVEIFAQRAAAQISRSQNATESWLLHFGEYLLIGVLPYVVPCVLAVWLHSGLRSHIFGSAMLAAPSQAAIGSVTAHRRSKPGGI